MKVTKSDWLTATQCLAMAWCRLRAEREQPTEAELFRMEQGREVGERARVLYSNGIFVGGSAKNSAAERTQKLVADPSVETLFEAAFTDGPLIAKADILRREDSGWHVLEVKSSFSDTDQLDTFIDDIAYTVMVLKRAGLNVVRASMVFLSREFCYGDGTDRLFEIVAMTKEVATQVAAFEASVDNVVSELNRDGRPDVRLVSACRDCRFWDRCLGAGIEHSVLHLPNLSPKKVEQLSAKGIVSISDLPTDFELTKMQSRVKECALDGQIYVDPDLRTALGEIRWPCHYLDFETVATVLPLYPERRCHEQVLTQFSVHRRDGPTAPTDHCEFLADAASDCERELAEELIRVLSDHGSVMVYTHFEKTRINGLIARFPDLAARLEAIVRRIVDLSRLVRLVYHPRFRGSFSIKKVLPALVPELSYDGLEIGNGDTAITRFARMARGEIANDEIEQTRQQLLEYCKLDTLAMVRLHEQLQVMSDGRAAAAAGTGA